MKENEASSNEKQLLLEIDRADNSVDCLSKLLSKRIS